MNSLHRNPKTGTVLFAFRSKNLVIIRATVVLSYNYRPNLLYIYYKVIMLQKININNSIPLKCDINSKPLNYYQLTERK